jgi:membrane protein YqaA with SNARE-associated domain
MDFESIASTSSATGAHQASRDHKQANPCVNLAFHKKCENSFLDKSPELGYQASMLNGLYNWVMKLAAHRNAAGVLAIVSFVESSLFPIPPDAFLIPMVLARRERAWWYAFVCTLASVLGGILGYFIGAFLFDTFGRQILDFYGFQAHFEEFSTNYTKNGGLYVFGAGLTPFPYKVITIASGVIGLSLPVFIAASVTARSLRFFAVAGLLYYFGPPIKVFIEKYLGLLTIAFFILVIAGFYVIKFM